MPDEIPQNPIARLLRTPMNRRPAKTIGDYLCLLLLTLWQEADGFSGKGPFGNSDWQFEVYAALIRGGLIEGEIDEDGYIVTVDDEAADFLIEEAIVAVFAWSFA